ncbi:hypothetical protein PanWU01x14_032790 [Parasponia andersonii]|uniref:Uncharacterized protein n=1 Tax=Parasponia andersonii TaxID=3476 RepID=A0A2P5DTH3_PARAD|nr:hypothetical protein PanWU01x14_032790 [Parasponia andersonii]
MTTQTAEPSSITRPSQTDQARPISTSFDASSSLPPSRTRRSNPSLRISRISGRGSTGITSRIRASPENSRGHKAAIHLCGAANMGDFLSFVNSMDILGVEKKMVGLMAMMDKFLQNLIEKRRRVLSENSGTEGENNKLVIDSLLGFRKQTQVLHR